MKAVLSNLFNRLANLITIKSIITLIMTVVFAILSLRGIVSPEVFISVFTVIIGFYFGTQKVDDTSKTTTDDVSDNTIDKETTTTNFKNEDQNQYL